MPNNCPIIIIMLLLLLLLYSISGVYFLYTFDATGTVDQFRRSASVDEELLLLPGPGPMYVVGRYAYFQLFVIDPRVS